MQPTTLDIQPPVSCGFVALVGRPNVGKSTLLNAYLGEKVSIVSPKPQTTRTRIHGILNRPDCQVVFVDTPGLCGSGNAIRRAMRGVAGQAAQDADVTLLLVEPHGDRPEVSREDQALAREARRAGGRLVVALNKIDRLKSKSHLLPWIEAYAHGVEAEAVVPISARYPDGLAALLETLVERLPQGPRLFPEDLHTDQAERFLCGELVRERMLFLMRDEVPHCAAVVIETFEDLRDEREPPLVRLEGRIYVERDSQKGIVVGKGGAQIKQISQEARRGIESLLQSQVYLRLTVHVDPDWTRRADRVRHYGIGDDGSRL